MEVADTATLVPKVVDTETAASPIPRAGVTARPVEKAAALSILPAARIARPAAAAAARRLAAALEGDRAAVAAAAIQAAGTPAVAAITANLLSFALGFLPS